MTHSPTQAALHRPRNVKREDDFLCGCAELTVIPARSTELARGDVLGSIRGDALQTRDEAARAHVSKVVHGVGVDVREQVRRRGEGLEEHSTHTTGLQVLAQQPGRRGRRGP